MRSTLRYYWEELRTSYWFLPALLGLGAIGLSLATVQADHATREHASWLEKWSYGGGPEGARAVLATIASSMITVAGVVFSITIVALSLASGQFGPRLLRNFIRDRRNQFVLGIFTATFLYCLLVLRTVRGNSDAPFVPSISVSVGMVLAVANLGVLIYFIHHVAMSIQATHVIGAVSEELRETIDRLWPEELGHSLPEAASAAPPKFKQEEAATVPARGSGYVDAIKDEVLMQVAMEHDVVIRLGYRPGHFAIENTPLAWVWPSERLNDETTKLLQGTFVLANHRSPFQDIEFAIDQLVEIAVRALSPGVNDPFTALSCIDRLGEALCRMAGRSIPSPLRYDDKQQLRVLTHPANFSAVTDAAFNQIRQYGSGSAAVMICLLEAIATIVSQARRREDRDALARHAELIARAARRDLPEAADVADVEERLANVKDRLA